MSAPKPKSTIAAIAPYVAGAARAAGFEKPIKLSANENALGCSPNALAAYRDAASDIHRYPDPGAERLRAAIARKFELDPARIVFGTGSDEVFSMLSQAYLMPGDNIVQPHYAFAAWAIAARAAGGEVRSASERDFHVDVDALLAAVNARTRLVFIANPANPSGTLISKYEVERLHAGLSPNVLLVLDGAYAEFATHRADYSDGLDLARAPANVVVTRTFSKAYGLAALRIGWAYASVDVADALNRIRLPFNTPAPAQAAARAALEDEEFLEASVSHAISARERLVSLLTEHGLACLPPDANFVTARARDAQGLVRDLAERGILVRGLTNYDMPDFVRVTVGAEAEIDALERALRDIRA